MGGLNFPIMPMAVVTILDRYKMNQVISDLKNLRKKNGGYKRLKTLEIFFRS